MIKALKNEIGTLREKLKEPGEEVDTTPHQREAVRSHLLFSFIDIY